MKRFDDIFREKVKEAFSSYNDDIHADEGWKAFARKRKSGSRFAIIIPIWAKAASVAILLSLGGIYIYRSHADRQYPDELTFDLMKPQDPHIRNNGVISAESPSGQDIADVSVREKDFNAIPEISIAGESLAAGKVAPNAVAAYDENELNRTVDSDTWTDLPLTEVEEETEMSETVTEEAETESDAESAIAGEEMKREAIAAEIIEASVSEQKTSLMAGFAGVISGMDNMASAGPGISLGLFVDQKLGRKLSFRPGISVARYAYGTVNVAYDKVYMNAPASASSTSGYIDSYDNTLDLITMEIPLNFAFNVFERGRKGLFVSAGTSTLIYLSQQLTGNYVGTFTQQSYDAVNGTMNTNTSTQSFDVEQEEKAFSHVDLFGLANFSAGYSFPLGKNSMLIEPYVQLPVSDLTSLDLKIRYGGLSFKYRFGHQSTQTGQY